MKTDDKPSSDLMANKGANAREPGRLSPPGSYKIKVDHTKNGDEAKKATGVEHVGNNS